MLQQHVPLCSSIQLAVMLSADGAGRDSIRLARTSLPHLLSDLKQSQGRFQQHACHGTCQLAAVCGFLRRLCLWLQVCGPPQGLQRLFILCPS